MNAQKPLFAGITCVVYESDMMVQKGKASKRMFHDAGVKLIQISL